MISRDWPSPTRRVNLGCEGLYARMAPASKCCRLSCTSTNHVADFVRCGGSTAGLIDMPGSNNRGHKYGPSVPENAPGFRPAWYFGKAASFWGGVGCPLRISCRFGGKHQAMPCGKTLSCEGDCRTVGASKGGRTGGRWICSPRSRYQLDLIRGRFCLFSGVYVFGSWRRQQGDQQ
jgi:hypothetical protein